MDVQPLVSQSAPTDPLRESEERFRLLVESVRDYGIFMLDPCGIIVSWNQGAERISGYKAEEILGRHLAIFYSSEEIEAGKPQLELQVASTQGRFEEQGWRVRKDGSRYWAEVVVTPLRDGDGNIAGFAKVTRDLTERAAAEEAARRHSLVFATIGDGVLVMDLEGRITDMNPAAEQLFGYHKSELLGRPVITLHHPRLQGKLEETIQEALRRDGRWAGELPFRRKDGRDGIADIVVVAQRDSHGTPRAWIGVNRDITERVTTERELVRTHSTLSALVNAARGAMVAVDATERGRIWNTAAERLFGWTAAEVLGKPMPFRDTSSADDYERVRARVLGGQAVTGVETRRQRRDGTFVDVLLSCAPFWERPANVAGAVALYLDLSEYRQLEDQLRQSQKMEALGQLAGGVAHDFNNLLTVIKAYSGLVAEQLEEGSPLRTDVGEIQRAAGRAASLTQQLLAFSRKQVLQPRVLDLNVVARELEPMLRRLIGDEVGIEMRLPSTVGRVRADRGQLEQVLINLVVNARDAMPKGGTITIETADRDFDDAYRARHSVAAPGAYVMFAVTDTGIGMDAPPGSRMFEPFFTTKPAGKGTGLGLSTVYGIVKQSSGYVWVYSEVGLGTTFKVYLPRLDADEIRATTTEARSVAPVAGSETVLLVEDDPAVRSLSRRVLERHGYTVLEAHHGRDALRVADQFKQPIQLLLTDMMMPELTGADVWATLSKQRPDLRVLFMSGYTNDEMVRRGLLEPRAAFVQKPFTPFDRAGAARAVLDGDQE